jgi:hypothetical protein
LFLDQLWHLARPTGGSHLCSDDFFNAHALITRDEEIAEKTKMKKTLQNKAELREKGMVI